jgi:hypothetical protein
MNKSMRTNQVALDLTILKTYLQTLTAYRDAQDAEEYLGPPLPIVEAQQRQKDLAKATELGMVPIALSGLAKHAWKKSLSRHLVPGQRAARWTAKELTELAKKLGKTYRKGKEIKAKDVWGRTNKIGNVLKIPTSVEGAQAKWLDSYIDPGKKANNICVYSDMKMNGYDLYRKDVSPLWVEQSLHKLHEYVFFIINHIPGL